jgi:hypothetical protein
MTSRHRFVRNLAGTGTPLTIRDYSYDPITARLFSPLRARS